ncbi:MAG: TonB-dependent receptor domain-containing protein, partial [Gammaproteobacteria bacterium]
LTSPLIGRLRNRYYGLFIDDSWKLTAKLTLNLGLRYDLQTPFFERDNHMTSFDLNPASPTHATLVPAANGVIRSRTFSDLATKNLAPRIGAAYQMTPKTVLRAAFGIFYGGLGYQDVAHTGVANPPNFVSVSLPSPTSAAVSNFVLADGFPSGFLDPAHVQNPNLFSVARNFPMPMVNQWNVAVERELPGNSVLTVAYVGSSAEHLSGDIDVNAPPPGPGAINPRRLFPQYGQIIAQSPYAHSTYAGLQVTFQRRFSRGFSLLTNYTWSHSLDNVLNNEDNVGGSIPQDPHDSNAEKASSGFDVQHRFVTSVIYQLPIGQAGGRLGNSAFTRTVFGGWQIGGIFVAQGGFPLTLSVSPNPANTTT